MIQYSTVQYSKKRNIRVDIVALSLNYRSIKVLLYAPDFPSTNILTNICFNYYFFGYSLTFHFFQYFNLSDIPS